MVILVLNHSNKMEVTGGLRGLVKAYIFHIVVFQLLILSQSALFGILLNNFGLPLASIKYNATVQ